MKAHIIERAGGPEVLTLADVPAPQAQTIPKLLLSTCPTPAA